MLRAQSHQSERSPIINLSLANQDIEDKLSIVFDVKNLAKLAKVDRTKDGARRFEITLVNIFNDFYDKLQSPLIHLIHNMINRVQKQKHHIEKNYN